MRALFRFAFGCLLAFQVAPAWAGVYADDLSRCLVGKSTDADKIVLMKWFFSALSGAPAAKGMVSITPQQQEAADRNVADLFIRMLTVTCRSETVNAMKYEGESALTSAFGVFGEAAVRSLTSDPTVAADLGRFSQYMDKSKLEALGKEAGVLIKGDTVETSKQ